MKTQPTIMLVTLSVVILFSCSPKVSAQQRDGEVTSASTNNTSISTPSGRVNLSTIQVLNGEYIELFGTGTSHGILRGHPSISAIELGSLSDDPLIFSTNSTEKMRILANGFVGIGVTNPINPFEVQFADANVYSPNTTSPARIRLINNNSTLNNVFEIDLASADANGGVATGVRLASIFTNKTPGSIAADFAIGARNNNVFSEIARFTSTGNVGIGTSTPGVALDVAQNKAIRVGNATLSSGGDRVHLASHAWYNGSAWQFDGTPGALYQIDGQKHLWWSHNGANNFVSLMFLNESGNLGIGTTSPTSKLDVVGAIRSRSGGFIFPDGTVQTTANSGGTSQWTTSGANIYYAAGSVGVGTTSPGARLAVVGLGPQGTATFTGSVFTSHFNYNGDATEDTYIRGGKTTSRVFLNDQNTGHVLLVGSGNLGIGTFTPTEKLEVVGNIKVSGNINAKYQDVAEWVPAEAQLAAGTVVVLDSTKPNQVISSNTSYDTRVAGVISQQPGIALGEKSDNKVLVATTGRVRVKVDATNAPIQIGDLLVTSTREGFAMKSLPVEIGGARMHRPGTLIGKALEPLAGGTGEILVLLSLQ